MQVRARAVSAAIAVVALGASFAASATSASADRRSQIDHVLLISVDGMHQSDLDWYIASHPHSELARLASGAAEFTNNHTSDPSDSDPGGTAIMTGGDPRATGVYYDVEYTVGDKHGKDDLYFHAISGAKTQLCCKRISRFFRRLLAGDAI